MTERAGSGRAHKRARKTARPTKKGSSPATPDLDGQDTGGRSTIQHQLLDLQRRAGNRAVTGIVDRLGRSAIQRVEVTDTKMSETLYDKAGTGGKAKAKDYAITPSYVLTRN
ncbi:MAG TPA: hypothetical protein VNT27_12290, partial [Propionibacteriaceae bacterium]|nr:hypothetical protein [Propionibacteriaceae bacterium]